jgi:copper oxidase (laccase) domain-containing protein
MIFSFSRSLPGDGTIVLYGGKHKDPVPIAEMDAHRLERRIDYMVLPPSNHTGRGFKKVECSPKEQMVYADGVLLAPGKAATIRSKDCPIVFIKNRTTGWGVLVHAGRAAMTPDKHNWNIITTALFAVETEKTDILSAYIRGGICGRCFVHDWRQDRAHLEPFLLRYSSAVDRATGGIDLPAIIVTQLRQGRIPPERIDFDGFCTLEEPGLSSHRGKDPESNLVLALN